MEIGDKPNKSKYDLACALLGAGMGAGMGAAAVGAGGVGVVAAGVVAVGVVAGAVVAVGGIEKPRPRHLLIGGFSAALLYTAVVFGAGKGYDSGSERGLTPFKTERYEGIVVERNKGTLVPYVLKDGKYISLDKMRETDLNSTSEEWRNRESEILKVIGGGK